MIPEANKVYREHRVTISIVPKLAHKNSSVYKTGEKTQGLGKRIFGWLSDKSTRIIPVRSVREQKAPGSSNNQTSFVEKLKSKIQAFLALFGKKIGKSHPQDHHSFPVSVVNPLEQDPSYPSSSVVPGVKNDGETDYVPIPRQVHKDATPSVLNNPAENSSDHYKEIAVKNRQPATQQDLEDDSSSTSSDSDHNSQSDEEPALTITIDPWMNANKNSQKKQSLRDESPNLRDSFQEQIEEQEVKSPTPPLIGMQREEEEDHYRNIASRETIQAHQKETDLTKVEADQPVSQNPIIAPIQDVERKFHVYPRENEIHKQLISELANYREAQIKQYLQGLTDWDRTIQNNISETLGSRYGYTNPKAQLILHLAIQKKMGREGAEEEFNKRLQELGNTKREKIEAFLKEFDRYEDEIWNAITPLVGYSNRNLLAIKERMAQKRLNDSKAAHRLDLFLGILKVSTLGYQVLESLKREIETDLSSSNSQILQALLTGKGKELQFKNETLIIKDSGKIYLKVKELGAGVFKVPSKVVLVGMVDIEGKTEQFNALAQQSLRKRAYLPTQLTGDKEAAIHLFLKQKKKEGKPLKNVLISHSVSVVTTHQRVNENGKITTKTTDEYGVLVPLRDGDIDHLLDKPEWKKLTDLQKFSIAAQMANGISELHEVGIVHRDLNTGNFLFSYNPEKTEIHVVVSDYGLSSFTKKEERFETQNFPVNYLAPEFYEENSDYYSTEADIFQLGIALYQILTGMTKSEFIEERKRYFKKMNAPDVLPTASSVDDEAAKQAKNKLIEEYHQANFDWKQNARNWESMKKIPEGPAKALLLKALYPTPASRPTAKSLAKAFETLSKGAAEPVALVTEAKS